MQVDVRVTSDTSGVNEVYHWTYTLTNNSVGPTDLDPYWGMDGFEAFNVLADPIAFNKTDSRGWSHTLSPEPGNVTSWNSYARISEEEVVFPGGGQIIFGFDTVPCQILERDATFYCSVGFGTPTGVVEAPVARLATATTLDAVFDDFDTVSQPLGLGLTATVTGSSSQPLTGLVYFYDGGALVGMASVNAAGVAACTVVNPTDGTHVLTAVYQGDATSDSSGSSAVEVTVVITRATTITKFNVHTLWPDDYAELPGVMLIAAVAPQSGSETPTGTVTFTDDGATVGTVQLVNGVATLTIPHIVAGSHAYIANYKGDSAYRASVSLAITQTLKVYSGGNGGEFFVPSNSETLINTEASELDPPENPPAPIIQPMGEDLTWKNYEKITAAQVKDRLPDGYDLPLFGKDIAAMTVWNFVGKYSFDYNTKIVAGNITDGYSARVSTTQVVVKFSAVFNPKGSFVVKGYETGNDQEILLFHERTHLMLAEYVAARSAPNLPAISAKGAIGGAGSEEFALGGATARMKSDINAQLDTFRLKIHKVDNKVQDAYHDALTGTPAEAEVAQLKWYRNHTYYADPVIQNAGFIE